MTLNKPFYEKLPLLYFAIAIIGFFYAEQPISLLVCGSLYFLASLISVRRSNYRRENLAKKTVSGFRIPQPIYEYYPFVFIACALALIKFWPEPLMLAIALILILWAGKSLILRRQSRLNPLKFNVS